MSLVFTSRNMRLQQEAFSLTLWPNRAFQWASTLGITVRMCRTWCQNIDVLLCSCWRLGSLRSTLRPTGWWQQSKRRTDSDPTVLTRVTCPPVRHASYSGLQHQMCVTFGPETSESLHPGNVNVASAIDHSITAAVTRLQSKPVWHYSSAPPVSGDSWSINTATVCQRRSDRRQRGLFLLVVVILEPWGREVVHLHPDGAIRCPGARRASSPLWTLEHVRNKLTGVSGQTRRTDGSIHRGWMFKRKKRVDYKKHEITN